MSNPLLRLGICLTVVLGGALNHAYAETLETASFKVTIDPRCPEGEVTCDNVYYTGISKASGKQITLRGKTRHTLCADGVTPCRFIGYSFRSGKTEYFVDENGTLIVKQGTKTLLQEQGEWLPTP